MHVDCSRNCSVLSVYSFFGDTLGIRIDPEYTLLSVIRCYLGRLFPKTRFCVLWKLYVTKTRNEFLNVTTHTYTHTLTDFTKFSFICHRATTTRYLVMNRTHFIRNDLQIKQNKKKQTNKQTKKPSLHDWNFSKKKNYSKNKKVLLK